MSEEEVWSRLGLEPTQDLRLIKQAYAHLIRTYRPESHPKEFSDIREAYEAAQFILRRDAELAQAPADTPATTSSEVLTETATPSPKPQEVPPTEALPVDNNTFDPKRWVQALLDTSQPGDATPCALLHSQFAALATQTIDAKLDYEGHLLYGLLSSPAPALGVLFDASRLFRWPERRADIVQMFGEGGAQRLGLLMEMAYEFTHAQSFCSNGWKRRLFDTSLAKVPRIASLVHAKAALETGNYWQQLCDAGNLPQMRALLNPAVLKRLQGGLVYSTDLLLAALMTWFAWLYFSDSTGMQNPWIARVWSVLIGLGMAALPAAWRWLTTTTAFRKLAAVPKSDATLPKVLGMAIIGISVFLVLMSSDTTGPVAAQIAGRVILTSALVSTLSFAMWYLLRYFERLCMGPWTMLQRASDAYAFDGVRHSTAAMWNSPTRKSRFLALPNSVKIAWAEYKRLRAVKKQKEREAQATTSSSGGGNNMWWIWIALVVLLNLAKAISK